MYTIGTLVGLPLAILAVLICLVIALLFWREGRRSTDDEMYWFAGGAVLLALVLIVATGWFMWPWKAEFHRWQAIDGKVTSTSSRLLPAGKGTEQKFVVVLDSHPGVAYAIRDTRAALLRKGDPVSLRCVRSYQYQSESGWDCRWNGGAPSGNAS